MKKFLAIGCAAAMIGTACMLTACGGDDPVIEGNYTEPTAEQLETALAAIDEEKLFGDPSAEGYTFGLSADGGFSLTAAAGENSINMDGSFSGDLSLSESAATGAGELSFDMTSSGDSAPGSVAVDAAGYLDSANFYIDLSMEQGGISSAVRGKLSLETILDMADSVLGGAIPELPLTGSPVSGLSGETAMPDLGEMLAELKAMGVAIGLDSSDGVKLRLDASAYLSDTAAAEADMTLTRSVAEIYFYVNADGLFEQFSAVIDLEGTVPDETGDISVAMSGSLIVKQSDASVELPSDLSDAEKYPSLDDLFSSALPY